jgi:hypothetical protein
MSSPAPRLPNKTGGSTEVLDPKDDEQTLEQQGMGIPVSRSSDTALPAGTLGIYFGPEPQTR